MLEKTKLYQELEKRQSSYREKINKVYKYAKEVLPKINNVSANYTGHGIEHFISVMNYMYDLITNVFEISELKIACLIDAALLHTAVLSDMNINNICANADCLRNGSG